MIHNFIFTVYAIKPSKEVFKFSLERGGTSEEVLAIARNCLEREAANGVIAFFEFTENDLQYEIIANNQGYVEDIEITGSFAPPESVLSHISGEKLSKLIEISKIVDKVIGNPVITNCSYDAEYSCLNIRLAHPRKGWWFMR